MRKQSENRDGIFIEKNQFATEIATESIYYSKSGHTILQTELYNKEKHLYRRFWLKEIAIDIEENNLLTSIVVFRAKNEWQIIENIQPPGKTEDSQVYFHFPEKKLECPISFETNSLRNLLHIKIGIWRPKFYIKASNSLILEIDKDYTLVGIWILTIREIDIYTKQSHMAIMHRKNRSTIERDNSELKCQSVRSGIYVSLCSAIQPLRTATFHDLETDIIILETSLYDRNTLTFRECSFSKDLRLKIDKNGYLTYIELLSDKEQWEEIDNFHIPIPEYRCQVSITLPLLRGRPRVRYQTDHSRKSLYIGLKKDESKYTIQNGDTIMLEVNHNCQLIGIWLLDIFAIDNDSEEERALSPHYKEVIKQRSNRSG